MTFSAALRPTPDDRSRRPASVDYRTLARVLAATIDASREMQRPLRVMALGIDYRQFDRFTRLTPTIAYFADMHSERHSPPGYAPTSDDFEFCRGFVITAALRVAEQP